MSSQILFSEKQYFRQLWIWLILLAFSGYMLYMVITQLQNSEHIDNVGNTTSLAFGVIGLLLIVSLFVFARLETIIKNDGIYYQFFPFHFKMHKIEWSQIDKAYIRKYNAILEYGGWGIRLGIFGKGRAYNVSGNMGLQLELKNGKKILFGTKKPEEIKQVLVALKINPDGVFFQTDRKI